MKSTKCTAIPCIWEKTMKIILEVFNEEDLEKQIKDIQKYIDDDWSIKSIKNIMELKEAKQ